jgi:hypothetical protein
VLDLRGSAAKEEKGMVQGRTPELDAPITRWTQVTAFDTAKDCEAARAEHLPKRKGNPIDAISPTIPL